MQNFWQTLWPEGIPAGFLLNIFALPERTSWYYERVPQQHVLENVLTGSDAYFGVGLSRTKRGPRERFVQDDIECLPGVFLDIDFKATNTRQSIEAFIEQTLPPSLVVATGGGFHVYWLFNKPLMGKPYVKSVLSGWKHYISTLARQNFVQVDAMVIEPARVLRIPGFVNHKPTRNGFVVSIEHLSNVRYDVTEIPQLEAPIETREPVSTDGIVGEGKRNDSLFRFLCYLRKVYGADNEQLYAMAIYFNNVIASPPLAAREVEAIAKSVQRYKREVDMSDRAKMAQDLMYSRVSDGK